MSMAACIEVMQEALTTLARGEGVNPLRWATFLPEEVNGLIGMMPAYLAKPPSMGLKAVTVMPGNHGTPYDAHQGAVLLFETKFGRLQAMMDASEITGIRTGAVSGLATRLLARQDANDLAILGSGVQASSHLAAVLAVRSIKRIRVWSRSADNAREFAQIEGQRHGMDVEVSGSAQEATDGADIICTTTSAREPVLEGRWLSPGAHVNAAGSSIKTTRELDTDAIVRSRLFVDRRESTLNEAGDFLFPRMEGAVQDDHIQGELGEILLEQVPGRETREEITLFKSLGLGVEDIAAAHYIYSQAVEKGVGTWVEWGGERNGD
jgi:ornithine cyclodeaminase/alanine dehydrogenase-like protein (mu-crystallin family)